MPNQSYFWKPEIFKTNVQNQFWVQNYLLNLCTNAVNSQRFYVVKKLVFNIRIKAFWYTIYFCIFLVVWFGAEGYVVHTMQVEKSVRKISIINQRPLLIIGWINFIKVRTWQLINLLSLLIFSSSNDMS